MKKTLLALIASLLPLTFTQPAATAAPSDRIAASYISQAYDYALDVYDERRSNESYYSAYYAAYSSYFLYYGAFYDDDNYRYYGYLYAYYAFYYASLELENSSNSSPAVAARIYAAYYYSYAAYYYAYFAYIGY